MPRDVLEDLLARAVKAQRRKQKQAELEAEALERVEKKRKIEELNSAFDSERFRFLASILPQYMGRDLSTVRRMVDDEIEKSIVREYNEKRKVEKH